jgi:predicted nuclease with TOPRIM domain
MKSSEVFNFETRYQKLQSVGNKLTQQQKELEKLRLENENLNAVILKKNEEIKQLNSKVEAASLAASLTHTDGNQVELKNKLSEFIKEIDKCIALLNS